MNVQAMQGKGPSKANPLHQLPVALLRRRHCCLREGLLRYHIRHSRWDSTDAQVHQHPVHRTEEQPEADKPVFDEMSHWRRRLVLFSTFFFSFIQRYYDMRYFLLLGHF